jgi:predicted nuclease of predicted toxin-antitoxin system
MAIRFHLDEHIDREIATGLRTRGIDVTTSAEAGLLGTDDEAQLEFASREQRVLFTNDHDFLRLHSQGVEHAGIAYCARGSRSPKEIIRYLALIHDCLTQEEMAGQVEFL